MTKLALLVAIAAVSNAGAEPLRQIEPNELLTIPHILRTPVISSFALAPDGKRIALHISVLGTEAIWLLPGDGTPGASIPTTKGTADRDPAWSPDGHALAFVSNRHRGFRLYVADEKGANARLLVRQENEVKQPRWSPDGSAIAYLSRADGDSGWDLWLTPADGSTDPKQLTRVPFDEEDPRWSPDGEHIAVSLGGGRHLTRRIGIVTARSGEISEPLPDDWGADSFGVRWSHDGKKTVFVSDEPGHMTVYLLSTHGGAPERVLSSPYELTEPEFSPDGRFLAYLENQDGDTKLWTHDFETGRQRTLSLRNGTHTRPVWRPDGKAVLSLFEAWNYSRDVWVYPLEGGRERASDTLPPDLDVRKMARPELLRFPSFDSREITGYLYVPELATADKPVPLIVTPHGGPTSHWRNSWHPFVQLLVQRGYAVLAPNVRGSSGFGREFENLNDGDWGRGDLEDLITGAKRAMERPEIRDDRAAIWGVSYGGFLTLAAITRYPDFFACAIEALGMPDLENLYRETTEEGRAYLDREIGPLRGNLTLYRELSPVKDVSRVRTPLLSFHGEIYPLVPYSTKKSFFDVLRQRPDYRLQEYIFKGEEARATYRHDLHPEAAWAYVEKILEFLEIYL
ncbi:MAG TPA: S9 family peptidase [Vicinamibacteria bacterium]